MPESQRVTELVDADALDRLFHQIVVDLLATRRGIEVAVLLLEEAGQRREIKAPRAGVGGVVEARAASGELFVVPCMHRGDLGRFEARERREVLRDRGHRRELLGQRVEACDSGGELLAVDQALRFGGGVELHGLERRDSRHVAHADGGVHVADVDRRHARVDLRGGLPDAEALGSGGAVLQRARVALGGRALDDVLDLGVTDGELDDVALLRGGARRGAAHHGGGGAEGLAAQRIGRVPAHAAVMRARLIRPVDEEVLPDVAEPRFLAGLAADLLGVVVADRVVADVEGGLALVDGLRLHLVGEPATDLHHLLLRRRGVAVEELRVAARAIAVAGAAALDLATVRDRDVEELAPRCAHLLERSLLRDLGLPPIPIPADLVLERVGGLLVEEVGDGPQLAIAHGERAAVLGDVALRAGVTGVAGDGVLAGIGGAVLVGVVVATAGRVLVALLPDVVDRLEAMRGAVLEPVLRIPRGARGAEPRIGAVALAAGVADHVLPRVVVLEFLEVLVGLHAREAGADGGLLRVAVEGRRPREIADELALLDLAPREAHVLGVDGELVRDVEVAVLGLEMRRVLGARIRDVVRDGRDGGAVAEPDAVVGRRDQVLRPVDAYVLALVPRAIAVVLDDDVRLLAGGRVVVAPDVEVLHDLERRDDGARGSRRCALVGGAGDVPGGGAAVVGARRLLIRAPRQDHALGDVPANAIDGGELADRVGALADRAADGERFHPELGVVVGALQVLPQEERLRQRVGLHSVDGITLGGAASREASRGCEHHEARSGQPRAHGRILSMENKASDAALGVTEQPPRDPSRSSPTQTPDQPIAAAETAGKQGYQCSVTVACVRYVTAARGRERQKYRYEATCSS